MSDVYESLMPQLRPNYSKMKTIEEVLEALVENDHCTAIIKITDDYQDILIGHSTWDTYANMNRVFKQYEFNFNNPLVRAKKIQFSSYPGVITSGDDYYLTDQQLVIMETTNGFLNDSLYSLINPHTLYSWQRVQLATAFASTGEEWSKYMQMWNSGTYAN